MNGIEIKTDFNTETGLIIQEIDSVFLDTRETITRRVTNTQDEQVKRALIALGWTPPNDESVTRQSCPNRDVMGEHACDNRAQCWEPCGELGKSDTHVGVSAAEGAAEKTSERELALTAMVAELRRVLKAYYEHSNDARLEDLVMQTLARPDDISALNEVKAKVLEEAAKWFLTQTVDAKETGTFWVATQLHNRAQGTREGKCRN